MHYGPLDFSKDGKAKVLEYRDELPDDTWKEPNPDDPLSLVDKVTHKLQYYKTKPVTSSKLFRLRLLSLTSARTT